MTTKKRDKELPAPRPEKGKQHIPDVDVVLKTMSVKYLKEYTVTLDDMENLKLPSVRVYPAAFAGSKDCQEMNVHEFSTYSWLMHYLWMADIQCFMQYSVRKLKPGNITPKKFIQCWNRILGSKFHFVKIYEEIYIYQRRQLKEWFISKQHSLNGKKNKDIPQRITPLKSHEFKDSPYFDIKILTENIFQDPDFREVDTKSIKYWHSSMILWSKDKKKSTDQKLSTDWLSKIKNHLLSDMRKPRRHSNGTARGTESKVAKNMQDLENRKIKNRSEYAQ